MGRGKLIFDTFLKRGVKFQTIETRPQHSLKKALPVEKFPANMAISSHQTSSNKVVQLFLSEAPRGMAWGRDWEREWAWRREWEKRGVMPWWRKIGRNGVITENFWRVGVIEKIIGRDGVICRNCDVMAWLRNWRDGVIEQKLRHEGLISRKFRREGLIGTPFGGPP